MITAEITFTAEQLETLGQVLDEALGKQFRRIHDLEQIDRQRYRRQIDEAWAKFHAINDVCRVIGRRLETLSQDGESNGPGRPPGPNPGALASDRDTSPGAGPPVLILETDSELSE